MKDAVQMMFAGLVLLVIGVACGWAGLIVVPAIVVAAIAGERYRVNRAEMLRQEAQNAQADYVAALAELENARADLVAAQEERRRVRDALRAGGWLVADVPSLN